MAIDSGKLLCDDWSSCCKACWARRFFRKWGDIYEWKSFPLINGCLTMIATSRNVWLKLSSIGSVYSVVIWNVQKSISLDMSMPDRGRLPNRRSRQNYFTMFCNIGVYIDAVCHWKKVNFAYDLVSFMLTGIFWKNNFTDQIYHFINQSCSR